jgi:hypothetical protein
MGMAFTRLSQRLRQATHAGFDDQAERPVKQYGGEEGGKRNEVARLNGRG